MNAVTSAWIRLTDGLESAGEWLSLLFIRLLLAWEFWESGITKLQGQNWFGDVQGNFPFPFDVVPPDISWQMATWFEILGALGLLLGLFTRFWAVSLAVLTVVAILAVHWGVGDPWSGDLRGYQSLSELAQGYAITNKGFGNYKLPLIFLVMLVPLVLSGPGRLSMDCLLRRRLGG